MEPDMVAMASESSENYLKAILVLQRERGRVRRVDLANYMGFSRASITHSVHNLQKQGYLRPGTGDICLTSEGMRLAEQVLEKHRFFTKILVSCGVEQKTAEKEACGLEHMISDESFLRLEEKYGCFDQIL